MPVAFSPKHMEFNTGILQTSGLLPALGAAFLLGVTGSLHCVLMCGPLACAAQVNSQSRVKTAVAYQSARVVSYGLAGMVMGGVGTLVSQAFSTSVRTYLPWVMALTFVAAAMEWGRFLPRLPGASRLSLAIARVSSRFSPTTKAASIGLATAFLPCGLLYGVLAVSAASGSVVEGGLLSSAFALGGLPALAAISWHTGVWAKLGNRGQWVIRRGLPLAAAVALVVRTVMVSQAVDAPVDTPHSCH